MQVAHAVPQVATDLTVLIDDSVVWPSENFLPTLIAPFETMTVGLVGTSKLVHRVTPGNWSFASVCNLVGCLYLTRHNFEIRASNAVPGDHGVFVVSGRTAAHRTRVLQDRAFLRAFTNERFFFGLFGPLNADDDNFITRWYVTRRWDIKIQYGTDANIKTSLGTSYVKLASQLLRWARTTWRSNPALLLRGGRVVWLDQPWSVFSIYLASLTNFALVVDPLLVWTFRQTAWYHKYGSTGVLYLVVWILLTKLVKTFAHFVRHPADIPLIPVCILFGYLHSFIKLYAAVSFWDCSWGGRNLATVDADAMDQPSVSDMFFFNNDQDEINWASYHFGR
jgi:hypothetical protein